MAVESFVLSRRGAYADGATFGEVGAYEQIEGVLHYSVDPHDPANARIVDLQLAPRSADGLVRFRGALQLLRPRAQQRGNGTLLVDVPNRGRNRSLSAFNQQPALAALTQPLHPGDGFLFRRGFTLASIGWQFDVDPALGLWLDAPRAERDGQPLFGEVISQLRADRATTTVHIGQLGAAPYTPTERDQADARLYVTDERTRSHTLVPRSEWQFAKQTHQGVEASNEHVYLRQGFVAGQLHQLVFVAEGAPVVGCGLLAVRDGATWLRASEFAEHQRVLGFGVSQTGRLLRQFLYEGMNVGERGQRTFDGLLVHIAGGQRGDFNHRFAQPSAAGAPSFGQLFPFAGPATHDSLSGRTAGLFDRVPPADAPKVFFTNTSWEYWRGDAGLIHVDAAGRDVDVGSNVRIYHFAGTQHINGVFPLTNNIPEIPVRARDNFSIVDHSPLVRAALVNLDAWVRDEAVPPPARHPRVSDNNAQTREQVQAAFAQLPNGGVLDAAALTAIRVVTLDPDAGHTCYPLAEGAAYPGLVSSVDADGNEIAGIRLPAVSVPVGTHTGWNPRHPQAGAPEQAAIFVGFTRFFAADAAQRAQSSDSRLSILERYADRDDYLRRVETAAAQLVAEGYVLAEDEHRLIAQCRAHFDHATAQGALLSNPPQPEAPQ